MAALKHMVGRVASRDCSETGSGRHTEDNRIVIDLVAWRIVG